MENRQETVLATGGGTILDSENREVLSRIGVTVALMAQPETLYERLRLNPENRPLLEVAGSVSLEAIRRLWKARGPFYQKMKWCISTDDKDPATVAQEILGKLRNWQKPSRSR